MKKIYSVFLLFIGNTFRQILLIFAAMTIGQWISFQKTLNELLVRTGEGADAIIFGDIVDQSPMYLIFVAAFLFLTLILCINGCDFKEKSSYTWRRLALSEQQIFLCQTAYGSLCYMILFALQIGIFFVLFESSKNSITVLSDQSLFLSFYSSPFLHSLLPLDAWTKWIRNFLLLGSMGVATAYQPYAQRRKKKPASAFLLCFLVVLIFKVELGSLPAEVILSVASLYTILLLLTNVLRKEVGYDI